MALPRLEKDLGDGIKVRAINEGSDHNGDALWGWAWFDEANEARWLRRMPTLGRKQVADFALGAVSLAILGVHTRTQRSNKSAPAHKRAKEGVLTRIGPLTTYCRPANRPTLLGSGSIGGNGTPR